MNSPTISVTTHDPMLAFKLPVPVAYDVPMTLLSVIPAVGASAVVLWVISRQRSGRLELLAGGMLMGTGIGAMHYIGMAAMRAAATMRYDLFLFVFSLVVAVVLATGSLQLHLQISPKRNRFHDYWKRLGTALVMGLAVSGMHYTGMAAAYFFPATDMAAIHLAIDPGLLGFLVALAAVLILVLAIFVTVIDRHLKAAVRSARISRSRMTATIESISEGFCLYDAHDTLVVCNNKYRDFFYAGLGDIEPGVTFEHVIRRAAESGLIPVAEERIETWVAERLKQHRTPAGPFLEERRDGRWFQISERKTDDDGIVAVYTDITQLKQAELDLRQSQLQLTDRNTELNQAVQTLQAAQAHLVQSERMAILGKLTAGIAHEVNNPIGAVNSAADVSNRCIIKILSELANRQTEEVLQISPSCQQALTLLQTNNRTIATASDRITQIVTHLTNFAHLDEAAFQWADLHQGLESTLALIQHELVEEIIVVKEYGDLPLVYCNPSELNQVFMTLLTSAAQAVEGKGMITIRTRANTDGVSVGITDTGKGISPEKIARLFELDFSAKRGRVAFVTELFTANHIAQKHGGTIEVNSEVGKGTEVTINLPMRESASDNAVPPASPQDHSTDDQQNI